MVRGGLVLFLTYDRSLQDWAASGILEREVELYRRLSPRVGPIAILTYGSLADLALASDLDGIRVLPNRWRLPAPLWSLLAPAFYAREFRRAAVLKTNQASGAWTAVLAKRLYGNPLVVRCGYAWSAFRVREGRGGWKIRVILLLERLALRSADRIIVTTEPARRYLVRSHGIPEARFVLLPNPIDTETFAPDPSVPKEKGLVCVVARLHPQKNLAALIEALRPLLHLRLRIIGDGPDASALRRTAQAAGVRTEFCGTVPNHAIPGYLNRAELFVLPSLYEGSPKSLLEAMACGLPVIGTDVDGIREVIRHRETGYLCGTTSESLRAAILEVMNDAWLRETMGAAARTHVVEEHSVESVVAAEAELLESLIRRTRSGATPVTG